MDLAICSISVLASMFLKPNVCCLLCCGCFGITGCKRQSTKFGLCVCPALGRAESLGKRDFAVESQPFWLFVYVWIKAEFGNTRACSVVEDLFILPFSWKHRHLLMVLHSKVFNQLAYWYLFHKDFWHVAVLLSEPSFTSFSLITSSAHCLSLMSEKRGNSAVMMRNPRMRSCFLGAFWAR